MPKRDGIGFDLDGRPLPMGPDQVNAIVDAALTDPDSHLLLCIFQKGDDIMVNILGEPSRETLRKLDEAVKSYRKIVRDREKGQG